MLGKNVYLIGFMGSGKTTVGRVLSERLGYTFTDTDDEISLKESMTIPHIFEKYGESFFRASEHSVLKKIITKNNCIVATGGGIIKNEENINIMKQTGVIVYLRVTPEQVAARTEGDHTRPLLNTPDRLVTISALMKQREALYEDCADYIVDSASQDAEAVAGNIIEIIVREADC